MVARLPKLIQDPTDRLKSDGCEHYTDVTGDILFSIRQDLLATYTVSRYATQELGDGTVWTGWDLVGSFKSKAKALRACREWLGKQVQVVKCEETKKRRVPVRKGA